MPLHQHEHPLAGQTVVINDTASDPAQQAVVPGAHFTIENWWDRMDSHGKTLWENNGNWAAAHYGYRAGLTGLPHDDEIVYGKINGLGHAVHVSELGDVVEPKEEK